LQLYLTGALIVVIALSLYFARSERKKKSSEKPRAIESMDLYAALRTLYDNSDPKGAASLSRRFRRGMPRSSAVYARGDLLPGYSSELLKRFEESLSRKGMT